jgi:hypothetical protein
MEVEHPSETSINITGLHCPTSQKAVLFIIHVINFILNSDFRAKLIKSCTSTVVEARIAQSV